MLEHKLEKTENIGTKIIPKEKIMLQLKNQEIKDGGTLAVLFYTYLISTILLKQAFLYYAISVIILIWVDLVKQ